MKIHPMLASVAVFATLLTTFAIPANAGVIGVSSIALDGPVGPGESMVQTFDSPLVAGYSMSWSNAGIYQGPDVPGVATTPAGDATKYLSVYTGGLANLTAPSTLSSLSVYLGSIDSLNAITFKGAGGFNQTIGGALLLSGPDGGGAGDRRFYFTFDTSDQINQVLFASSVNSFEFDNIAVKLAAVDVPEPLTLSLFGAGLAGAVAARGRRKAKKAP